MWSKHIITLLLYPIVFGWNNAEIIPKQNALPCLENKIVIEREFVNATNEDSYFHDRRHLHVPRAKDVSSEKFHGWRKNVIARGEKKESNSTDKPFSRSGSFNAWLKSNLALGEEEGDIFNEKLSECEGISSFRGSLARISHKHSSRFGQTVLSDDKESPAGRVKLTLPRVNLKSDGETGGQSGRTVCEKCGLDSWREKIFAHREKKEAFSIEKRSEYEQLLQQINGSPGTLTSEDAYALLEEEVEILYGANSGLPPYEEYAHTLVSGMFSNKDRPVGITPERRDEYVQVYNEMVVVGLAECREVVKISSRDCSFATSQIERTTLFPILATLQYRGGNGRSYSEGYESAGLFLAYHRDDSRSYPFIDLRALRVDRGKFAANCGLGWRVFSATHDEMFGANVYYDYRRISNGGLHQLGLGMELLGKYWDIRGNGYIPLANQRALVENLRYTYGGGYVATNEKYETGMWGVDVEIGQYLCRTQCFEIYNAIGPYFYGGSGCCDSILGGMGRLNVTYKKYLTLQIFLTHDKTFQTQAQGEIFITIPSPCSKKFRNCFYKPVERNNIILTEKFCSDWQTNY